MFKITQRNRCPKVSDGLVTAVPAFLIEYQVDLSRDVDDEHHDEDHQETQEDVGEGLIWLTPLFSLLPGSSLLRFAMGKQRLVPGV